MPKEAHQKYVKLVPLGVALIALGNAAFFHIRLISVIFDIQIDQARVGSFVKNISAKIISALAVSFIASISYGQKKAGRCWENMRYAFLQTGVHTI